MKLTPPANPNPGGNPGPAAPQSPAPRHRHSAPAARGWSPPARQRATPTANPAPHLRLVNDRPGEEHQPTPRPTPPTPISGATDPRWVLAVRTAESLQGDVLPPAQRARLMRLAKALGLTPFDGCLILAMIQDQARRGLIAQHCPAAAEPQLAMVPLPQPRDPLAELRKNPLQVGLIGASVLALQALLIWMLMS
ncbi:MAG: hypothetical protein ACIAXF_16435 [Phycisphaerales bacterium JB063]